MNTRDLLAAALAFFALVQVVVMGAAEVRTRRERKENSTRDRELAFQILHAEWFHVWSVLQRWQETDLLAESLSGDLQPEEILPVNAELLTGSAVQLGPPSAQLALMGWTLQHDTAKAVRMLNTFVAENRVQVRGHTGFARSLRPDLEARVAGIVTAAEEAERCVDDAWRQSSRAYVHRDVGMYLGARSKTGQELAEQSGYRPKPGESGWALEDGE